MHSKLKAAAPVYKLIKENPALQWLDKHYDIRKDEVTPMKEYQLLQTEYKIFFVVEMAMILHAIAGISYLAYRLILLSPYGGIIEFQKGVHLGIIFLSLMLTSLAFWAIWRFILIPARIDQVWKKAGFAEDVARLACFNLGMSHETGTRHKAEIFHHLGGNGMETAQQAVPEHVKKSCREQLFKEVLKAKRIEIEPDSFGKKMRFEATKAITKRNFDLCKKFNALPRDVNERELYRLANEVVQQEPSKKGQGSDLVSH